jgi:hydrogenase expression/formation protein HypE
VSGPIGCHGIAVLAARGELGFDAEVESDTADLGPVVEALRRSVAAAVHVLRDPTRGGLASALNEIAVASGVGVELNEEWLPIPRPVAAACEILGLDPLYVANEGILVAFVAAESAGAALEAMRRTALGARTTLVGRATSDHAGLVALRTALGTRRVVDMLPGDQLPRIC